METQAKKQYVVTDRDGTTPSKPFPTLELARALKQANDYLYAAISPHKIVEMIIIEE